MTLTGTGLPVLLALVTLTLAWYTGWGRRLPLRTGSEAPRTTGRGTAGTVARTASVLGSHLCAVLLAAVLLNDYGLFYGSWADVVGSPTPTGITTATRGPLGAGVLASNDAGSLPGVGRSGLVSKVSETAWSSPGQWATRGRVESVTLTGARSGLSTHALVYLPPQYFAHGAAAHPLPAAEVFTGYPGNEANLVGRLDYPDHLLAEVKAGRAAPMVLVMLSPTVVPPRDTECTDIPGGPQVETFLAQDVPAAISAAFRVQPDNWGVIGDSTGGYCATKIAMSHSDRFAAAVALSGYFHTLSDSTTGSLWGGSPVLRNLNDPEWLIAHQPAPPVSILATSSKGETGPEGYQDTQRFAALARAPFHVDTMILPTGGHNFATWNAELPGALDWLSHHISTPSTVGGHVAYGTGLVSMVAGKTPRTVRAS